MRLGSGIKNKILQAWAMGRPVVATPESLGGIKARDGLNILVRDEARSFAEAVAELILDPERALMLGLAGRKTVEEEYSWSLCADQLDSIFEGLAAKDRCAHEEAAAPAVNETRPAAHQVKEAR